MDELVPWKTLFLGSYDSFLHSLFVNDDDIASVSWTRNVNIKDEGYAYSLMFSHLHRVLQESRDPALAQRFPRGIPSTGDVSSQFLLETAVDWIGARLARLRRPFAGYFHLLPPHGPYNTTHEFYNQFHDDGLRPIAKPEDIFSDEVSYQDLLRRRTDYDEFILYVDQEFGRFYDSLGASGLLENTWVVLTSDHGEMFERGISAHSTDALYEPVIRIPLMIFEPGRDPRPGHPYPHQRGGRVAHPGARDRQVHPGVDGGCGDASVRGCRPGAARVRGAGGQERSVRTTHASLHGHDPRALQAAVFLWISREGH